MLFLKRKKTKSIAERKTEDKKDTLIYWKPIGIGLLLWIVTLILFAGDKFAPYIDLTVNQKAPKTIISSVPFKCINLKLTSAEQEIVSNEVLPVFTIDASSQDVANQRIESLAKRLNQFHDSPLDQKENALKSIDEIIIGTKIEAQEITTAFSSKEIDSFTKKIVTSIISLYPKGILTEEDIKAFFEQKEYKEYNVYDEKNEKFSSIKLKDSLSKSDAIKNISNQFSNSKQKEIINRLGLIFIIPNLEYQEFITESLRKEARDNIEPVMDDYPAEYVLVKESEIVTKQTIELLKAHNNQLSLMIDPADQQLEFFGKCILLLAALIASIVMLRLINPEIFIKTEKLLLLSILALLTVFSARLLSYLSIQTDLIPSSALIYLVPHALAVLLGAILLGGGTALSLGFWGSFATAVYFDESFSVFVLGIFTTVTATTVARNLHRRSNLYKAGLYVAIVNIIFTLILYIFNQPELPILGKQLLCSIISAAISTGLTLLLIPLFEKVFSITTDITLLELSDMGHPLLQKMAIQAPGTYHHSLMVATLSQNAAEAIQANSLLVRVCAYYHDIGKLAKPEFFSENIQESDNPHEKLSPHMSALVIIAHVKEGLALAKRHKLPEPIIDAIEQHHGNGLIHYFYEKAKKTSESVNESDFRYGGNPAVSPEMAILSLADASEAASRSIKKPTPQKISNLIDEIFEMKLHDGQLDHAKLTMAQINTIKQSIVFSLSNMLHGRVSYKPDENISN